MYFSLNERNELNFPTNNLSVTSNINDIVNVNEKKSLESDDRLNQEEIEIGQFYKKYRIKKNSFKKTQSKKELDKMKIYFIVKSKIVRGKEVQYALPIRSFDDLGNSILEKSNAIKSSLFDLKIGKNTNILKKEPEYREGSPVNPRRGLPYRFHLEHLVYAESLFDFEDEFSLEDLGIPKSYLSQKDKNKLSPNWLIRDFGPYYSTVDNTFLINSSGYRTDIVHNNSYNEKTKANVFLKEFKDIIKNKEFRKLFNISNPFLIGSNRTNSSLQKNIIPVFLELEDAEDFLITILEEINQPFQVRRKIEKSSAPQYFKSINYLDDSFSFRNFDFLSDSNSRIEQIKNFLKKYRIIKVSNLSKEYKDKIYNENKYQIKRPFFSPDIRMRSLENDVPMPKIKKSTSKSLWHEMDYSRFLERNFPDQYEEFSWWESRDITETDKGLLKKGQDVKILAMSLGDFLEFWNNPVHKKAQVLFMPSSNELSKNKLNLSFKKPRDKFYDYHQKFRESKVKENQNYIYNIKAES